MYWIGLRRITRGVVKRLASREVMTAFDRKHVCTVFPFPEDMMANFRANQEDRTVCDTM